MLTMMSRVTAIVAAVLVGFVLVAGAGAQARPGDLIIGGSSGTVFAVTPGTNTASTVAVVPVSGLRGVMIGPDNATYYVAAGLAVFEITGAGVVTTLVTTLPFGSGTSWCDLDEDGHLLVSTGWSGSGGIFRVDRTTGGILATFIPRTFPNALCLDRDTGEVVAGEISIKTIFRVKRDGTVTTAATVPSPIYAMDFHTPSGGILVCTALHVFHVDALNQVTTFTPNTGYMKAIAVLGDGTVAIGENNKAPILHLDAAGNQIGTLYNGVSLGNSCMVVEDEHNVWGLNTPSPGGNLNLSVQFASHPGKPYVAAAALSARPGLPVDSRIIPLNPDNVFVATFMLPQIFVNFTGILDARGHASPYVMIPKQAVLRGLRLYFAAVVIDAGAPSGMAQISQLYGVTVQ